MAWREASKHSGSKTLAVTTPTTQVREERATERPRSPKTGEGQVIRIRM